MDQRAFSRFPSTSAVSSTPGVTVCHLLDKIIPDRVQVSDFCTCTNCSIQNTARETICCREVWDSSCKYSENLKAKMGDLQCVTQVQEVIDIVDRSLQLDLFHENDVFLKRQLGLSVSTRVLASDPHRHRRFAAYTMLTFFLHGSTGMKQRVELPSCLVKFVRDRWPNSSGDYTGFSDAYNNNE
uniref:P2X purinoreceptor 7 intracellular domain-containing protein n=1 Tax=Panagrolaimus davidi TaxID=227884 RepID=A0A914P6A5_9BILA